MNQDIQVKQVSKVDYVIFTLLPIISLVFSIGIIVSTIVMLFIPVNNLNGIVVNILLITFSFVSVLLFIIFLSWFLYVNSYKRIQTKFIGDKFAFQHLYIMKATYIIIKWFTFGWWIVKKYDYKKEMDC